jgi:hypothetical protein
MGFLAFLGRKIGVKVHANESAQALDARYDELQKLLGDGPQLDAALAAGHTPAEAVALLVQQANHAQQVQVVAPAAQDTEALAAAIKRAEAAEAKAAEFEVRLAAMPRGNPPATPSVEPPREDSVAQFEGLGYSNAVARAMAATKLPQN